MVGRTVRTILLLAMLAGAACVPAGCRSLTDPFLGVPEWKTVRYGDEDSESPLKGVPKITAVETREYAHYVRAVSAGRVVVREFRDDWVYYAVATLRAVETSGEAPAAPRRTVAVVYERYRAKRAPEPAPRLPVEDKPEPGEKATSTAIEKRRKRLREKAEKELRQRLPKGGDFKTIRPE